MPTTSCERSPGKRRGATVVILILGLFTLICFVALAVDVGHIVTAQTDLQRCADATALAALWEYGKGLAEEGLDPDLSEAAIHQQCAGLANTEAVLLANDNYVCKDRVFLPNSDIRWGQLTDFDDPHESLDASNPGEFNATEVVVRRSTGVNGPISLFFARVMGEEGFESQASATAAMVRNISGFRPPSDGTNLGILPIALDLQTWLELLDGEGDDDWSWNPSTKTISEGSDGIPEANLYPTKKGGAPGNRGTVDIGSSGNSTNDIERQILHGISAGDLAHHGGKLQLDANGELILNGDTGISAGIKDALSSIIGKGRVIPIFSHVVGPGNNADYTIVRFAGVRILAVKLTGPNSSKRVTIQPAVVPMKGVIPATPGSGIRSEFVFSHVFLIR